jgi:hypothetical protein
VVDGGGSSAGDVEPSLRRCVGGRSEAAQRLRCFGLASTGDSSRAPA